MKLFTDKNYPIIISCAKELARWTEREVRDMGYSVIEVTENTVVVRGDVRDVMKLNLKLRTAHRVLVPLLRAECRNIKDLYRLAVSIDWENILEADGYFSVSSIVHNFTIRDTPLPSLYTKDAIADQLRHSFGERPNVDKEDPDVRVFVYWARGKATVYLDLSGEPLFKRGYRLLGGEAPLKETLAAAVVRLSGWDRSTPLVDPMCGSGTLPIEAALWAADIAPNLRRERFGFQRWASFDAEAARRLKEVQGELRRGRNSQMPRITGFDIDERALDAAHANAQNAGLRLSFRRMPLRELQPDNTRRLLVCNPPYGIRLDADNQLYQDLANAVHRLKGWRIAILAGSPRCVAGIRIQPVETHPLKNGDIDCRLLVYEP